MRVNYITSNIQKSFEKNKRNIQKQNVQNYLLQNVTFKKNLENDTLEINKNNSQAATGVINPLSKENSLSKDFSDEKMDEDFDMAKMLSEGLKKELQKAREEAGETVINKQDFLELSKNNKNEAKTLNEIQSFTNEVQTEAQNIAKNTKELINDIQNQAQKVQKNAYEVKETVIELYNKGSKLSPDGKPLRIIEIDPSEYYNDVLKEFNKDGIVFRKSVFLKDNQPHKITEYTDDDRENIYKFSSNGSLIEYKEGYERLNNGYHNADKEMIFGDEKLLEFKEGFRQKDYANLKIAKEIHFQDDKPLNYREGHTSEGLNYKTDKDILFDKNGKISEYKEGCKNFDNGFERHAKKVRFTFDTPFRYIEKYENLAPQSYEADKQIFFKDGKLTEYKEGCKKTPDGSEQIERKIQFKLL